MKLAEKKLLKAYQKAEVIPYDADSRFIIMSDCHRGQGNAADNFLQNQTVYFGALEYYYQNGFNYIELGDGDELWENRKMKYIIEIHSDAFWMLSRFYQEDRFYMIYGNHDMIKRRKGFMDCNCENYYCDYARNEVPLFPKLKIRESMILENKVSKERIFLAHGHQGSFLNDTFWPLARFLVRYVWRPLELMGFLDPTGAGRSREKRERMEKQMMDFSANQHQMMVAGHTHRPVFSYPGDSFYFNDGSCVHPRCITGIEIEKNQIALVKWSVRTREDRSLYVEREVLEGPARISDYYKEKL